MSILSDNEIAELCTGVNDMINPFTTNSVRYTYADNGKPLKVLSYGSSSYGYDVRLSKEFKIFTNSNSVLIDPKRFNEKALIDAEIHVDEDGAEYIILPPNSYGLSVTNEYFKIPNDVMVIAVGKSTYARCFTGDTRIALVDGTNPTFLEAIHRVKEGERLFGYSVDDELKIQVSELIDPRKIATDEVIEVVLDNEEVIKCTADHIFITKDGREIPAGELKPEESLFPLYRVYSRGYEAVVQPTKWQLWSTHKLADDWNVRNGVYSANKNQKEHRHHKDSNKHNNSPLNIIRLSESDHISYHNRKRSENPEWKNWLSERGRKGAIKFWTADECQEAREKRQASLEAYHKSPEGLAHKERSREQMRIRFSTEEARREVSERTALMWNDPEYRSMMTEQCRNLNLRKDITEETLVAALESEKSIRGAARKLNCDRTAFRRFKDVVSEHVEKWKAAKVTCEQFYDAMCKYGSAAKAAAAMGISRSYTGRHFKEAVSRFYGSPVAENHKVVEIRRMGEVADVYCLTSPEFGNFALSSGVFVNNCSVGINVTPIEAGFEGNVVIEIANHCSLPVKIYLMEGIAQFIFFRGEPCRTSYADRKGKYQGQTGITLSKV